MEKFKFILKEKIGIFSLIIGIITITGSWIWLSFPEFLDSIGISEEMISYPLFFIFFSLIGLIFGVLDLKLKRKTAAYIGIFLCLIGLLILIMIFFIQIGLIKIAQ